VLIDSDGRPLIEIDTEGAHLLLRKPGTEHVSFGIRVDGTPIVDR
jgi:hypothetical protein